MITTTTLLCEVYVPSYSCASACCRAVQVDVNFQPEHGMRSLEAAAASEHASLASFA